MMDILQRLNEIDSQLFTLINVKGAVPALDWLFILLRTDTTWIPLYAFLLYYIIRYCRRYAIMFVLLSICCFGLGDFIAFHVIKPHFARLRPCYDPSLQPIVRSLVGCAGQFSMPSNHATNHFSLATFWFSAIYLLRGKKWWWFWIWAFLVGYSQVYVGKHFPFDILVGATLGMMIGTLTAIVFKKYIQRSDRLQKLKEGDVVGKY